MDLAEHGTEPGKPSDRAFGLWGSALLAAWALWPLARRQPEAIRWVALGVASVVALLAIARPSLLDPVHRGARWLTRPIRIVSQTVVLAMTYFLLLTPVALLRRWFGESPVALRIDRQARSYWVARRADTQPVDFRVPF